MTEIGEIQEIRRKLKKKLDPGRYEHTLGVAFTAAALAMCHGEDVLKAELAGTLHDCAKYGTEAQQLMRYRKSGKEPDEEILQSPAVLHAKAGRLLAEKKYGVTDQDVLNAVEYHTTGRAGMSRLEKIVFIADYIEPGRTKAENLPRVRRLAFSDLDSCMLEILQDTLAYLLRKGAHIHPDTLLAKGYFEEMIKGRTQND